MKSLPIAFIRRAYRWFLTPLRLVLLPPLVLANLWWWIWSPVVYAERLPSRLHSVLWWALLAWVWLVRKLWFWMGPWAPQVIQWRRELAKEGV